MVMQKNCRDLFSKWMAILDDCNEIGTETRPWIDGNDKDGNDKIRGRHRIDFSTRVVDSATMEYEMAMRSLLGMESKKPGVVLPIKEITIKMDGDIS